MRQFAYLGVLLIGGASIATGVVGCGNKTFSNSDSGLYDLYGIDFAQPPDVDGGTDAGPDATLGPDAALGPDMALGDLSFSDALIVHQPANAPVITIIKPATTTTDVVGNNLDVIVSVTATAPSAVSTVTLITANDSTVVTTMSPISATNYEGKHDITAISAVGEFTVTAIDTDGRKSTVSSYFRHDQGPQIYFDQPSADTAHGSVPVRVHVVDNLYPIVDPSTVVATVRQAGDVMLTQVAGATNPLQMTGTIVFSMFTPVLDGDQLIKVIAANSKGTPGAATKKFTVDNAGPSIVIDTPVAGDYAGGIIDIKATITDESGVNDATVSAVFAGNAAYSVALVRAMPGADTFVGQFDIRQLGVNYALPSVSVRADDTLGNHGELAELIVVDNTPPLLSLDPPDIQVSINSNNVRQCSVPFDPVGTESAGDGDIVQQVVSLKARIEDRGNDPPGLLVPRVSGINAASVRLVAIPASLNGGEILAVDTDGDTYCDDVNPLLVPTTGLAAASNASIQLALTPITTVGIVDYYSPSPPPPPTGCDRVGDPAALARPGPLCTYAGTSMTYILQYLDNTTPAIWTLGPIGMTQSDCIGLQLDTLDRLPEGPACVVAVATDNTGNTGVSTPLRICIDRGTAGVCTGWVPGAFPNCTGTYDKTTNTTSATQCTLKSTFPANAVRFIGQ